MKKTRRKLRLWSAMLALLLTVLYTVPAFSAVLPEETVEPQTRDPAFPIGLSYYESEHSYDKGIIDGAVYCLRNAYNGQYMDVNNAADANNTGICTYTFHGGPNQQFQINYIGQGIYEIKPVYSQRRLHINAAHDLVIYDKNWGVEQNFRIQVLDNGNIMIFPQYGNFSRVLAWDETRPQMVASKQFTALTNQTHAQWTLERVGDTEERYAKFYIRHATGGQYIDLIEGNIAEGSLVHACPAFYGNVNQEWKFQYDETTSCYYLKPSTRLDMALDYRGTNLGIYRGTNSGTQGFWILKSDMPEEGTDRPLFALKTSQNTYVTLGAGMSGNDNDTYRYISVTTEPTYCWILEGVPYDSKVPDNLNSVNNWLSANVEPGYMQEQYFYFTPTVTSRYKIELKNGNVDFGSITSEDGENPEVSNRKTYNGIRVADVFCQAGVTYYITVYSKNPVNGSTTNFSIRARQLSFVGHSNDDEKDLDDPTDDVKMSMDIDDIMDSLGTMNFHLEHRREITAASAKAAIDPITGYSDFNAEIFVYSGHGTGGIAAYEKKQKQELFPHQLPDMSNCELAIWDCCLSGASGYDYEGAFLYSLMEVSGAKGAKASIGWSTMTCTGFTREYMNYLFEELATGKSIGNANEAAKARVQISYVHSTDCMCQLTYTTAQFLSATELYGDMNYVIFPKSVALNSQISENVIEASEYDISLREKTVQKKITASEFYAHVPCANTWPINANERKPKWSGGVWH